MKPFGSLGMSETEWANHRYVTDRYFLMDSQKLLSWRDPNYTAKFNHYILEEGINPITLEPATAEEIQTAEWYNRIHPITETLSWGTALYSAYVVGYNQYYNKPYTTIPEAFGKGKDWNKGKIPSVRNQPVVSDVNPEGDINNNIAKEPISRPTWGQSELDVGKDYEGYDAQKSFINGEEGPYGTKGSVRPEFYKNGHSVEVKNYDIETSSGRNSLINNVSSQIKKRLTNLPEGTEQTVVIDVRGQEYNLEILRDIKNKIIEKSGYNAEILFKRE